MSTALVHEPARSPVQLMRPIADASQVLAAQEEIRKLVVAILVEGRDYGKIPGTQKKSLLKSGAERTCVAFGVYPIYGIVEQEIDHDRENVFFSRDLEKLSFGLYRYVIEAKLISRETGAVVGTAIASCSTLEAKYISRPRDSENTVLQMAEKRAHVAATRTTFGLSDEFTQDMVDEEEEEKKAAVEEKAPHIFTLEEALALPLPMPNSLQGKPLSAIAEDALDELIEWVNKKPRRQDRYEDFLRAAKLVQESRAKAPAVEKAVAEFEKEAAEATARLKQSAPAAVPTEDVDPTGAQVIREGGMDGHDVEEALIEQGRADAAANVGQLVFPEPGKVSDALDQTRPPYRTVNGVVCERGSRVDVTQKLLLLLAHMDGKEEMAPSMRSMVAATRSIFDNPRATGEQLTRALERLETAMGVSKAVALYASAGGSPTVPVPTDDIPF